MVLVLGISQAGLASTSQPANLKLSNLACSYQNEETGEELVVDFAEGDQLFIDSKNVWVTVKKAHITRISLEYKPARAQYWVVIQATDQENPKARITFMKQLTGSGSMPNTLLNVNGEFIRFVHCQLSLYTMN